MDTFDFAGYLKRQKRAIKTGKMKFQNLSQNGFPANKTLGLSQRTVTVFDCFDFSKWQRTAHYCDAVTRKQKPTKMGEYAEITYIF